MTYSLDDVLLLELSEYLALAFNQVTMREWKSVQSCLFLFQSGGKFFSLLQQDFIGFDKCLLSGPGLVGTFGLVLLQRLTSFLHDETVGSVLLTFQGFPFGQFLIDLKFEVPLEILIL